MTSCALAAEPPNGQTSSERLPAGTRRRRRRRSRGRVRAWQSSRERVINASSRHLAVSPSARLAVAAATHAPPLMFLYSYFVRRNVARFNHISFTTYTYYCTCTHFAWPRESSHFRRIIHVFVERPRPLYYVSLICAVERFASHLRRVATLLPNASLSFRS